MIFHSYVSLTRFISWEDYPLVICYITDGKITIYSELIFRWFTRPGKRLHNWWEITMLLMGKSTILTGPFSMAMLNNQKVYHGKINGDLRWFKFMFPWYFSGDKHIPIISHINGDFSSKSTLYHLPINGDLRWLNGTWMEH